MSKSKFVTAVRESTGYASAPILKGAHLSLSVTGVSGLSVLTTSAAGDEEALALTAEIDAWDDGWTDYRVHDYETVATAWADARLSEFRNLPIYTIGQWVNEHYGQSIDIAVMTRRDDLTVGDLYLSSHFGKTIVTAVTSRGLTTTIRGQQTHESEIYDRSGLVPVFRQPRAYEQFGYGEFVGSAAR